MKSETNGHLRKVLEFESFRFYPAERLLEQGGKRIRLTPRLMDLLILLLDHRGELVTKETILQTLWPNSFVEENNINQAVSSLRKKLSNGVSEFIETVPKVGFRFIVPVIEAGEEIKLHGQVSRTFVQSKSYLSLLAAGVIIAAAGFGYYWYLERGRAASKNGLINLTNNLAEDNFPMRSPDGKKIVFTSNRDGNGNIYSMNIDGSGVTRLTNVSAEEQAPTWSPDGSKIVFESNRDGNFELYVMNLDGSGQKRLTFDPRTDGGPARFSPDGTKIAFARSGATEGPDYYNFDIYTMNADGSDVKQLTTDKEYDAGPVWSPDGSKIAFVSAREKNFDLFVMNPDGSDQVNLTKSPESDGPLDWTRDGKRIIFGQTQVSNGINQLWIMNSDGAERRQLTSFVDNSYHVYSSSSIPGKIVITSRKEGNSEIYLLDLELPGF